MHADDRAVMRSASQNPLYCLDTDAIERAVGGPLGPARLSRRHQRSGESPNSSPVGRVHSCVAAVFGETDQSREPVMAGHSAHVRTTPRHVTAPRYREGGS